MVRSVRQGCGAAAVDVAGKGVCTTRWVSRFVSDESGTYTIFGVYIFVLMLMVGGIGVDLMRFERDRTNLQYTLDRAVLAAADLDQPLDPESVVRDYFDKAGMSSYVDDVTVTPGVNFRLVSAEASAVMETHFMHMTGVDTLTVPAIGAAEERVPNVEVSLVLDISGSMRFNERMNSLRPAAVNFIGQLLKDDAKQKTSINLIPYAGQTNPGPFMFNRLNGDRYPDIELLEEDGGDENDRYPNVSSCMELLQSDFDSPALPSAAIYKQTPHFMNWKIAADVMDWGWCPRDETSIVYASNSASALNNRINTMRMHDGTGTHYAMKWAVALLNPSSQPSFNAMNTAGIVPDDFKNRPSAWLDTETVKYIVLMTDGQITEQVRPGDPMHEDNPTKELKEGNAGGRTSITSASTNIQSFYKQCDLAKDPSRNIIVYTIAFDAPSGAKTEMSNCASSTSHFFVAGTDDIDEVFNSIASQINELKLVN